jgi:uncharacterized protein
VWGGAIIHTTYDVIIIGAGPAGLAAAYVLSQSGYSVLALDRGIPMSQRKDDRYEDVSSGVGGAGLFSDGKLSFHPSATKLWDLKPTSMLEEAYKLVANLLSAQGVKTKKWDSEWSVSAESGLSQRLTKDNRKIYESIYIDIDQRKSLVKLITDELGCDCLITQTNVSSVRRINDMYEVTINGTDVEYQGKAIIYAAGRYGALYFDSIFKNLNTKRKEFIRYEIGVRVECDSLYFKPYKDKQTDYKYIKSLNNALQVRTFCCCRNGKVVRSRFHNTVSFNGSGDVEDSTRSNIGINLRILGSTADTSIFKEVELAVKHGINPFEVPLSEFMNNQLDFLGPEVDRVIREAVESVLGSEDNGKGIVYGPSVEGVGYYPKLDDKGIRIPGEQIWIPGDCGGLFRGLLAALVSGVFAALDIDTAFNRNSGDLLSKLNIKISPTQEMKMVFTAQSKVYFYCRDVVCEYVLRSGCLPINPFRVFDYFLGDRVDRNLIRQGNNQLIKSCAELWVFGPIADGVLFEIAYAKQMNMPIRFFKISTRIEDIQPLKFDDIVFEPEIHAKQVRKADLIRFLESPYGGSAGRYEQMPLLLGDF